MCVQTFQTQFQSGRSNPSWCESACLSCCKTSTTCHDPCRQMACIEECTGMCTLSSPNIYLLSEQCCPFLRIFLTFTSWSRFLFFLLAMSATSIPSVSILSACSFCGSTQSSSPSLSRFTEKESLFWGVILYVCHFPWTFKGSLPHASHWCLSFFLLATSETWLLGSPNNDGGVSICTFHHHIGRQLAICLGEDISFENLAAAARLQNNVPWMRKLDIGCFGFIPETILTWRVAQDQLSFHANSRLCSHALRYEIRLPRVSLKSITHFKKSNENRNWFTRCNLYVWTRSIDALACVPVERKVSK